MSTQPEALRLADALEQNALPTFIVEEAAAELRRLHDRLNKTSERTLIQVERIAALEQVGRQALEALENYKISDDDRVSIAMSILQERLAQPEQKPFFTEANGFPQTFVLKPEQSPLDRMAENARELGLDYEPVQHTKKYVTEQPVAWGMRDFNGSIYDCISTAEHQRAEGSYNVPLYTTPPRREWLEKLWLWRNHVDGRPEYWAFDNPYPLNLDNDDPQTIGEPCGYAIFKESRDGSRGRTEEYVLSQIGLATFPPRREWVGLTEEERDELCLGDEAVARAIEAKLKEKNG